MIRKATMHGGAVVEPVIQRWANGAGLRVRVVGSPNDDRGGRSSPESQVAGL